MKAVTKHGTVKNQKRNAYQILHNAIFSGVKKYTIGNALSSYHNLRRNRGKLNNDWWENRKRKTRQN